MIPSIAAVRCLSVTSRIELENWTKPGVLEWPIEMEAGDFFGARQLRRNDSPVRVGADSLTRKRSTGVEDKFWAFQVLKSGFRICNSHGSLPLSYGTSVLAIGSAN